MAALIEALRDWPEWTTEVLGERPDWEDVRGWGVDHGVVVMRRPVLIYVSDKASAFSARHRLLKPGGRISLFEPMSRRITALNKKTPFGCDASPVADLAAKVWQVYQAASP